jgi:hypothetical protein
VVTVDRGRRDADAASCDTPWREAASDGKGQCDSGIREGTIGNWTKRKLLGHGPVALKMLSAKALSRTVSLRDTTRWYTPRRRPSRADMTSLEPQALLGRCAVDAATMRTHTRLLGGWRALTAVGIERRGRRSPAKAVRAVRSHTARREVTTGNLVTPENPSLVDRILQTFATPASTLNEGIATFYDESSGLWEDVRASASPLCYPSLRNQPCKASMSIQHRSARLSVLLRSLAAPAN